MQAATVLFDVVLLFKATVLTPPPIAN